MMPAQLEYELDEESSSYLLRELELTAFTAVVSALRAQGIYNRCTETVLEAVKTALFINDETYREQMRRAANDDTLSKVANILNPSYDTYAIWGTLSLDADGDILPFPPETKPCTLASSDNSILKEADELLSFATSHNSRISDFDTLFTQLTVLQEKPCVPERLRTVLRDSETLHPGRILPPVSSSEIVSPVKQREPKEDSTVRQVLYTPTARRGARAAASTVVRTPRRRKSKQTVEKSTPVSIPEIAVSLKSSDIVESSLNIKSPATALDAPEEKKLPAEVYKSPPPTSIEPPSESSTTSVSDGDPDYCKEFIKNIQRKIQEEAANGASDSVSRRKRKPKQTIADTNLHCARSRPFIFAPANKDGIKPPRGNPERIERLLRTVQPPLLSNASATPSTSNESTSTAGASVEPAQNFVRPSSPRESHTVYNVIRRQASPSAITAIVQKTPTASSPPASSGVIAAKRARLSSLSDVPAGLVQEPVRPQQTTALPRRQFVASTMPITAAMKKLPVEHQASPSSSTTSSSGSPHRSTYFSPTGGSAQKLAASPTSQPRTPTSSGSRHMSESGTSISGLPASLSETSFGGGSFLKRSIFKAPPMSPASTVRMSNGSGIHPPNRIVTVHKQSTPAFTQGMSSLNASGSEFVVSTTTASGITGTQANVAVVRKIVSAAPSHSQMPAGQTLMRKTASQPPEIPSPTDPPAPKRTLYCEPVNKIQPPQVSTTLQEKYVAERPSPSGYPEIQAVHFPVESQNFVSTVFGDPTTMTNVPETLIRDIPLPPPYPEPSMPFTAPSNEPVKRVYKIQADGSQGMEAQEFIIGPTPCQSMPQSQPANDDRNHQQPDILQQSMMEIS